MANSKINVTDLDFDQIKNNLKEYLRGQSEFTDYDFEGSALSTLLDILAYNTHYQGLYYNLAVNEAFLDSASKRSSVVSKANEIGYTPRSITGAQAVVNVVMVNNQLNAPTFIEIPKYTPFNTSIDGVAYTFYTTNNYIAQKNGGVYSFNNVSIREGYPLSYRYVINETTSNKVIIPNTEVDTSTIRVFVQDNAETAEFNTFVESKTILNIDGSSKVYFLKELSSGQYEIQFGNGVVGAQLAIGNVVAIEYFVSKGSLANGAKNFSYAGQLVANTSTSVVTISSALGGLDEEPIESIRFNAPRVYTTQNRVVTVDDYKSIIKAMYPDIRSISIWGGDENIPPAYGKVFISLVPNGDRRITNEEKDYILTNIINPRKVLGITPEFVDPNYLRIELNVSFYYNPTLTTRTTGELTNLVLQTIANYDNQYLNDFGDIFRFSQLSRLIDGTENSIVSNVTTVKLHYDVEPIYNVTTGYQINIGNPIYNSGTANQSIMSSAFVQVGSSEICYIEDSSNGALDTIGTLRMFYVNSSGDKIYLRDVGSVDYVNGVINIVDLNITNLIGPTWAFSAKPQSNDVASIQNKFVQIDQQLLRITPVIDTTATPYTFPSSRS